MFDFLHEIVATIRRNKMRTFLTGFAVAWGIFLLIILLGAGNGLQNAATTSLSSRAANSVSVTPRRASMPYGGYQTGRRIRFDERDLELIRAAFPGARHVSAITNGNSRTFSYGTQEGQWTIAGVGPDWQEIFQSVTIPEGHGRFINEIDMAQRRKVVVLSPSICEVLFPNEEPLGKQVSIDDITYQVVGVYEDMEGRTMAFFPFSTAQTLYRGGYGIDRADFIIDGLNSREEIDAFIEQVRQVFASAHDFAPSDRSAVYIYSAARDALSMRKAFDAIRFFIWIIGIASMMAGIVGVGNIMLITVKERTREIGIRKAIGATPRSILLLIIFEAVFIMVVAGYAGILLGTGVTELVSFFLSRTAEAGGQALFFQPSVDPGIVLSATLFLIACGTLAGLIPALKATRVRPIEAMRAE